MEQEGIRIAIARLLEGKLFQKEIFSGLLSTELNGVLACCFLGIFLHVSVLLRSQEKNLFCFE